MVFMYYVKKIFLSIKNRENRENREKVRFSSRRHRYHTNQIKYATPIQKFKNTRKHKSLGGSEGTHLQLLPHRRDDSAALSQTELHPLQLGDGHDMLAEERGRYVGRPLARSCPL